MKQKDLISQLKIAGYIVYKFKDLIHIHSSTERGRMNHKYLCSLEKFNKTYRVYNSEFLFTNSIQGILHQIEQYLENLEYDSDYFYPTYREGLKEELYTLDYLHSLGFKSDYNMFTYKPKDIYSGNTTKITLQILGLSDCGYQDSINLEEVEIIKFNSDYSWVTTKVKRDFKSIKEGIDSMLKPLLIAEASKLNILSEQLSYLNLNLCLKGITDSLDVIEIDIKDKLKQQLTEILNKL